MKNLNFILVLTFLFQITTYAQHLTKDELLYDQILRAQGSSLQKENDILYKIMLKANEERRLERQKVKFNSEQYRRYKDLINGIPTTKYEVKYFYRKYDLASGILTEYLLLINKQYSKYSFYTFAQSDMSNPNQNLIILVGEGKYNGEKFESFEFSNDNYSNNQKLNFQYLDRGQNFIQVSANNVGNILYRVPYFNKDTSNLLKTKAENIKSQYINNKLEEKVIKFYEDEDKINGIYWTGVDSIMSLKNKYNDSLLDLENKRNDSILRIKSFNDSLKLVSFQELKLNLKIGDIFEGGIVFEVDELNNQVFLVSRVYQPTYNKMGEVYKIRKNIGENWNLPTRENIKKISKVSMRKSYNKFMEFDEELTNTWSNDIWIDTGEIYRPAYNQVTKDGKAYCLFIKII